MSTPAPGAPAGRIWTPEAEGAPLRLFAGEADIARIGAGLLAQTLPRALDARGAHCGDAVAAGAPAGH